jgi:uncharacterized protein (TIGR02145 family)
MCKKTILITTGISILAVLFYTSCDDNGVKVVTPEVTTFVDGRDGKTYKKVKIGSQTWMAENLRYEADGSSCYGEGGNGTMNIREPNPDGTPNSWIVKTITLSEHCDIYGRLYDWQTAMDYVPSSDAVPSGVEGVCPVGWHVPSDAEWQTLIDYVGINGATKLKSREWVNGGTGAGGVRILDGTDKYRFSALDGPLAAIWWSATERESIERMAWTREIQSYNATNNEVFRFEKDKHTAYSVRCVHD